MDLTRVDWSLIDGRGNSRNFHRDEVEVRLYGNWAEEVRHSRH